LDKPSIDLQPASRALSSARNRFSEPLAVLMVVVALVMLIACANVANLLLAKSGVRQREIAIRLSLGSSRLRLVRQLLTESLLLSTLGGLLGVLLAVWARNAIVYLATSGDNAPAIRANWNWRVLGFTAAVCILNAVLFGLAPALRATGVDLVSILKGSTGNRRPGRFRLGRILVAGQVALSLTLLVGAGLFLGTFRNLDRIDPGFDRDRVLLVTLDPTMAGYHGDKVVQTFKTALERTASIPGVRAVTLLRDRILSGQISLTSIWVPGYTLRADENPSNQWVGSNAAGPHFFETAGIRLVAGRDFSERDDEHSPKVAIINQSMAKHYFAGQNPIGRHIAWSRSEPPVEVVGVVRDIAYLGLRDQSQDLVFTPIFQTDAKSWNTATIFVRTADDSPRIANDIRAAIQAIDPNLPPYAIATMNQQVRSRLVQQRLLAMLTTFFGLLALTLSAVGLYGVVSYGVTQRSGEIGLRMALGASRGSILSLALGETARMAGAGVLLGIAIALITARFVQSMLYGITADDGASLAIAILVLTMVALFAGFLPARRASRLDPMAALRYE
jgi:predicted permease